MIHDADRHAVLEARPLTPTNVNLFSPAAYPEATPMVPAAGPPPMEAQVEAMLQDYLRAEFPHHRQAIAEGLALFDDPDLIAKIPNPSLRAGLIGLMGTAGEPAIDFVRNAQTPEGLPKVSAIGFDSLPWDPSDTRIGRAVIDPASQQVVYIFNPKFQSENPFAFTSIESHEVLHSDLEVATTEEVINLALQSYIYLEQLAKHPDVALADTELTRRNNTNGLARLNSGSGDELGLFDSTTHEPVLPGSPITATSWFGQFDDVPGFIDTPGNPLLRAYLANIAERGSVAPANPNFDMATLQFIDQNSARLAKELESNHGLRVFDALDLANVDQGDAGSNRLTGTAITDHLFGLAGDDDLRGLAGDDRLDGGPGRDRLAGGPGDDDLYGGPDADIFVVGRRGGHDVIHDFNPAEGDQLQVAGGLLRRHPDVSEDATGNTQIVFGATALVTLLGISGAELAGGGWDWLV